MVGLILCPLRAGVFICEAAFHVELSRITAALVAAAALLCALTSHAAIKSSKVDPPTIVLKRGSSTVESGFASLDACEARKAVIKAQDAPLRETGSAVYDCIHTLRTRVAFGPNPPAPTCTTPKPDREERPGQCPSGTIGAWTQSLDYVPTAYPTCWAPGEWLPTSPPADACVAPNRPPTISGTPAATGVVGVPYSFTPTSSDPDGDALTFFVDNRPPWVTFNTATGRLAGTPTEPSVRSELRIRVQDGRGGEAMLQFPKLTILAPASGSATVSWPVPVASCDGSPLTDLAKYRIVYGTSPTTLSRTVDVPPNVNRHEITQLSPGAWYFAVKALNSAGADCGLSPIVSKAIP
jgi:hypothetical protein